MSGPRVRPWTLVVDHAGEHEAAAGVEDDVGPVVVGRVAPDVAPAAVFLAGDGAGYITGQTLIIDGGLMAT